MRAHSSSRVTSFVAMRVRWRKILRLTRQIVRSYSEYHPRVRHPCQRVEDLNKNHVIEEIVRQVGHLPELHDYARSEIYIYIYMYVF
jgi:hypothetical protein